MKTRRLERIEPAVEIIKSGGTVVFPTETVFGLGADATNAEAVEKIYRAKNRAGDNPLIVHVSDIEQVEEIVEDFPEEARRLAEAFWPGPLTLVLKRRENIPDNVTGGLDTVGIRMPDNALARDLIRAAGPLAAPSANLSGRPSPTRIKDVLEDLDGRVDAVLLTGRRPRVGVESTVLSLVGTPIILRPGAVTKEMIGMTS